MRGTDGAPRRERDADDDECLADAAFEDPAVAVQPGGHREHGVKRRRAGARQRRGKAPADCIKQCGRCGRCEDVEPRDRRRRPAEDAKPGEIRPVDAGRALLPHITIEPLPRAMPFTADAHRL